MTKSKPRPPKFESTRTETTNEELTPEPSNTPEQATAGGLATGDVDGSHLSTFVIPENDDEFVDPDAPKQVNEQGEIVDDKEGEETLTKVEKDGFYATFKYLLALPGMRDPDFQPVAVQPEEEEGARAASDAIYELLEIWYPQALISGNKTILLMFTAGSFLFVKVKIVQSIIVAKRMAIAEAHETATETPPAPAQAGEPVIKGVI